MFNMNSLWYILSFIVVILNSSNERISNPTDTILTYDTLIPWKFNINPLHSRIAITKLQDILNPIPIQIEFIMSPNDFKKYGVLFEYTITTGISTAEALDVDFDIHQFTNNDNSLVKTQISNLKIRWNQLLDAQIEDFINKPFGILISFPHSITTIYNIKHYDNALSFYSPSKPVIFNQVPAFFFSQDYGYDQSQNATMFSDGFCVDIDKFIINSSDPVFVNKKPMSIKMSDEQTNLIKYNITDNAYHFNQGFCVVHKKSQNTSKVQFKIVNEDTKVLLSLSYTINMNDLNVIPIKIANIRAEVSQSGIMKMNGTLTELHDFHSDLIFKTFKPYVNVGETMQRLPIEKKSQVKKTCVYLKHAEMIRKADTFSQNDMFVKMVPDYDDLKSIRSATIKNQNNATWNEQICFNGPIEVMEFHVMDVDNLGPLIGIAEKNVGSATININEQSEYYNLRIRLSDISNRYVGTLVMDVMYIYNKLATNSTVFQLSNPDKSQANMEVIKTCVGIIKANLFNSLDTFSDNDAFVKVVPNYSDTHALQTKTIKNNNNPEFGQVLCFEGEIKNMEFYIYDVDKIISQDASFNLIGSTIQQFDDKDYYNFEMHLANNNGKDVGSLFINLFYVHSPKQIIAPKLKFTSIKPTVQTTLKPTLKPIVKPLKKLTRKPTPNLKKTKTTKKPQNKNTKTPTNKATLLPTKSPQIALFEPNSTHIETPKILSTCVHILRGMLTKSEDTFNENDAFVKIIPDSNARKSVKTKTKDNNNNPIWEETFCFEGEVKKLEFNVYDIDDQRAPIRHELIGSGTLDINQKEYYYLEIKLKDDKQNNVGSIYINIYFTNNQTKRKNNNNPSINLFDKEYMTKLSLYTDGYLLIGRGKCRNSDGKIPLYYYAELDPFKLQMDDPHGHCRNLCNLDEDCLGYVYHVSGIWKHFCALYFSMAIGDDSLLYDIINSNLWTIVSNGDEEINEISTIELFNEYDNDKVLGFCFVKTQCQDPIIQQTCVKINGFDPLVVNPPIINSAVIKAMSKPVSEEISVTLQDSKGDVCWSHTIEGFQFQFSSPSGGIWFIGDKSQPIGYLQKDLSLDDIQKSKRIYSKQKTIVFSTANEIIYDMNYDIIIDADHYGCCYGLNYNKYEIITYSKMMNLKLSQCVLEDKTYFAYNIQCNQLQSLLQSTSSSEFTFIGDGGCRDEDNLAPSRYWHDKLEFHSCQLQCLTDISCIGIMYFFNGRWNGRCLIYTTLMGGLKQLYQNGYVIPHQGWKWIDSDPSPRFDVTKRKIIQALGVGGSAKCFAKIQVPVGASGKSFTTPIESGITSGVDNIIGQYDELDDDDDSNDMTIRIDELNEQDPLSLPWPTQPAIFDLMFTAGHSLNKVCVLGQLHRSSFESIDGEYILMNRRINHNGKQVWYNKLNGYYLYWNIKQYELQIFDNIIDDDYFASLEKEKYWKLNDGEQDVFDQFLRLIPHSCPQTTCIQINGIVNKIPFSIKQAWIEINSMRDYISTNKTSFATTSFAPKWNQRFCFQPSPIALLQLIANNINIISETCVNILHGSLTKSEDTFNENDAFVKIIPDSNDQKSVKTKTAKNNNNPIWEETFCFEGQVEQLEFNVYDVDAQMAPIRYELIGSGIIDNIINKKESNYLAIKLKDDKQNNVGSIYINITTTNDNKLTTVNESILGKFHISPLTEGTIIRPIFPSELISEINDISPIFVELNVQLNNWEGEGIYDPNNYVSKSIQSIGSINDNTLRIEADRYKWIGYVGQKMTMIVHAFGTHKNNIDWSLINPGQLNIDINDLILPQSENGSPRDDNNNNLTLLMQHAMSKWTISNSDIDDDEFNEDAIKSAAMLSAIPLKKINYQMVVVAYEKDGDQIANIEIEIQVLRPPKTVPNEDRYMIGDEGRIVGRIDEHGNIIVSEEDVWNGVQHGKNLWILWWVLGTVGVTIFAATITWVVLRRKHFKPKSKSSNGGEQAIEMKKVNYHTVQKHTIKPVVDCPPGIAAEAQILSDVNM